MVRSHALFFASLTLDTAEHPLIDDSSGGHLAFGMIYNCIIGEMMMNDDAEMRCRLCFRAACENDRRGRAADVVLERHCTI